MYNHHRNASNTEIKMKPQQNETIFSLKYCKLIRQQSENAGEWMACFRIKANEYKYKERWESKRTIY